MKTLKLFLMYQVIILKWIVATKPHITDALSPSGHTYKVYNAIGSGRVWRPFQNDIIQGFSFLTCLLQEISN